MWQISGADISRCFLQIHHPIFVTLTTGTGQGWASISVNTVLPRLLCNTNRWTIFAAIQTNPYNTECSRMISTITKITRMKYYNICHQMCTLCSSISVKVLFRTRDFLMSQWQATVVCQVFQFVVFSNNNIFVYPGFTFSYSTNIVGESLWSSGVGISKRTLHN